MKNYYVYALIDPQTYLPFYVGKGKELRYMAHLSESESRTTNIYRWRKIQSIKNRGLSVIVVKLIDGLDEDAAYSIESMVISLLGRKGYESFGILTNICIDNRPPNVTGIKRSEETKNKIRSAQAGKKLSESHLRNLRASFRKGFLGKTPTLEHRKKISEANTGKRRTLEQRLKISNALKGQRSGPDNHMYGQHHTDETKAKMSESLKGKIRTPEFKTNLSNLYKGKPKIQVTCPHCNKTGGKPSMSKYHFDKCKFKCE